ncbi:NAD(P)/FAD-dependent oxidoreductase [Caldivirga maquilingensis]|uniref:FAD dependent oxidoreductase n=1 Tax=Caldivirga maquilingensis (strain ATCC 700844 / DSM 13496 / JCM 10307 / IC-167) TaxID=397948 RepID=A8MC17_CALMQ|nr:FAD-binding oxidoreductase [Caldivirga maquilingensis]ABW02801.1 FAD dependent oxidoreductase [Caldivirga maquilingensis IC-167]
MIRRVVHSADVVVVGGGVVGLATAYNLAKRGVKVALVDRGVIGGGSSTRNASRFRVQFGNRENTRYAIEAVRELMRIRSELNWNPMIRRGGYLWLFRSSEAMRSFEEINNSIWKPLGASVKLMDSGELANKYPYINSKLYVGAAFGPQDGELHHDYLMYGYLSRLREMGALIIDETPINKISVVNGEVKGVEGIGAVVNAKTVIVTAGAWSGEILKTAGVELPINAIRKEIGITAPVRFFIEPSLIIDTHTNAYFGQTLRGEIIGSIEVNEEPGLKPFNNTLKWLRAWAKAMSEVMPASRRIPLMRIWSGYYEVTPDNSHIMGRLDSWPRGLYVAAGFSGHGLMFGPLTGRLMADYVLDGKVSPIMEPFLPDRLSKGKLIKEHLVIG